MATTIGSMAVNIVARTAAFTKGMKGAQKTTMSFKGALVTAGTAIKAFGVAAATAAVAGIGIFIRAQLTSLDLLGKQSANLGITTEALSALQYTASIMGVSSEGLSAGLRRMEKSISDASVGLSTAVRGLAQLGLKVSDLQGLRPEEQFAKMGEGLRRVALQSDKARIAQDLFGRAGVQLIKTLELGSTGLKKMADEAAKVGGVITKDTVAAAEKLNDQMTRLKAAMGGIGRSMLDNWLIPLEKALTVMTELVLMTKQIVEFELWLAGRALGSGVPFSTPQSDQETQRARRSAFERMKDRSMSFRPSPLDRIPGRIRNTMRLNTDAASGYRPLTKIMPKPEKRESLGFFGRVMVQLSATARALDNAAALGRKEGVLGQRYAGLAERGTAAGFRAQQQRNTPLKQMNETAKKQHRELKIHTDWLKEIAANATKTVLRLTTIPS